VVYEKATTTAMTSRCVGGLIRRDGGGVRENDRPAGRPGPDELAAWNPTLLVGTAGQSWAAGPSSQWAVYAASVAERFTAFLAALLITERR
jgi:hypothetical protein